MKKLVISVLLGSLSISQALAFQAPVLFSCPTSQQLKEAFASPNPLLWGFKRINIAGTRFDFLMNGMYTDKNAESLLSANLTRTDFTPNGFGPTAFCEYDAKLRLTSGEVKSIHGIQLASSGWYTHQPAAGSIEQTGKNSFVYYPDRDK